MNKLKFFLILFLIFSTQLIFSEVEIDYKKFSGRISKINTEASLLRFKLDFSNQRYINKNDRVDFYNPGNPYYRCKGYVVGKSPDYILVKVPDYNFCAKYVGLAIGTYVLFESEDLKNNLIMGREVLEILVKKQMALQGQLKVREGELHQYIEKVNGVNERYRLLREKLEMEWRNEINLVEEDKAETLKNYRTVKNMLDDVNYKMQQYKIDDENLKLDRWALDPRLYYRK